MKNKTLIFFCLLLTSQTSFSSSLFSTNPAMLIDNHQCSKELQNLLYATWGASRRWQKLLTSRIDKAAFKSPAKENGKWITVFIDEKNLRTTLADSKKTIIIDWNQNCTKSLSHISNVKNKMNINNALNDSQINELIRTNNRGIIYIWSPEMPYSVQGITEIQKSAAEMGLNLTILLSPVADMEFAKKVVREKKLNPIILKRHQSKELHHRGIDLHYPSIITYKDTVLSRYANHGYDPQRFFTAYLQKEFRK